jgi:hypothetical protein
VQERLESSAVGRAVISAFAVVTVVALALWNLPDSEIKRKALTVVRPYVTALGLEQNWGVFAPDPRRESLELVARVEYADGTERTLEVPRGDPFVGEYWDYRWRKWYEWARADAYQNLWDPGARWFARVAADEGGTPVRVTLVRRWRESLPPGPGPARSEWHEFAYYTLNLQGETG